MTLDLFYPNDSKLNLMGFAYTCYLFDHHIVIVVDHKQDIFSHVVAQYFHICL